jgi:hypothetical protein
MYLEDEALFQKFNEEKDNYSSFDDYKNAITILKSINNIGRKQIINFDISYFYYLLENREKCFEYFKKAMELSFSPRNFTLENNFKEYSKEIIEIYNKYYNYNIDTNLRKITTALSIADRSVREAVVNLKLDLAIPENRDSDNNTLNEILDNRKQGIKNNITNTDSLLNVLKKEWSEIDSINVVTLINIVKEKGWPNINSIGMYNSKNGEPCPIIIVYHSDEIIHDWFYPIIFNACINGEEDWRRIVELQTSYLHYFSDPDYPYQKLKYIYLKNAGEIDKEQSLLQMYSIAKWMKDNPKLKYEFYPTELVDSAYFKGLLTQLKLLLMELGIDENRLSFIEKAIPVKAPVARYVLDLFQPSIYENYFFVMKEFTE